MNPPMRRSRPNPREWGDLKPSARAWGHVGTMAENLRRAMAGPWQAVVYQTNGYGITRDVWQCRHRHDSTEAAHECANAEIATRARLVAGVAFPPLMHEALYRTARKEWRCECPGGSAKCPHADCRGTIAPGDRYVEYLGESAGYQSGYRYCLPCGVDIWAAAKWAE